MCHFCVVGYLRKTLLVYKKLGCNIFIGEAKGALGTPPFPSRSNFFHFHAVLPNNRFLKPNSGVGAPVWKILDPPLIFLILLD